MREFSLYPGCLISTRLPFLEKASRLVLQELGITLLEVKGTNCCFDPIILKPMNHDSWMVMAARNIAIAEENGVDLLTLCNGCFCSLNEVNQVLQRNEEKREKINELLKEVDREFTGSINVIHAVQLLSKMGEDMILPHITDSFDGLKVATHHGCHLIRPKEFAHVDDKRKPTVLDELVRWVGAEPVQYAEDLMCCGGGVIAMDERAGQSMLRDIIELMQSADATHIVTPCPYCFLQFDHRQGEGGMPVLYLLELFGLGMGFSPSELGLNYHRTKSDAWDFQE